MLQVSRHHRQVLTDLSSCDSVGHRAADCPEPKKLRGECFNCGEVGHNKSECPNPSVFRGKCRVCDGEGHRANECPENPEPCFLCGETGHTRSACKKPRMDVFPTGLPEMTAEVAWAAMETADKERDMDDFKTVRPRHHVTTC